MKYKIVIDTESLIRFGGLLIVCLVVFGSTGFFFCFFLPSGAVLFTTGVLVASGTITQNLVVVLILLSISSAAGGGAGYYFGRKIGPSLYNRKDSFFFKRKHLDAAESFYKKYGRLALIAGYFLPIIRSFSPVIAGITKVNLRNVFAGTIIGSVAWVAAFTGSGYFMGSRPFLKPWLGYIIAGFILVVSVPLIIKIVRMFRG